MNKRTFWLSLIWAGIIAMIMLLLCSCATEAVREGFAQIDASLTAGDTQSAQLVSQAALRKYGAPRIPVTAQTVNRTISHIESDFTIGNGIGGTDWLVTLLGGGGIGGTLLLLLRQYLSERGKRRETENGATDIIRAIENLPEDSPLKTNLKTQVAKSQANRTNFGKLVKKQTDV
jgi:hypothetical protein